MYLKLFKLTTTIIFSLIILSSCVKLPGGDARKNPPDPKKRVAKNLSEGRGFRVNKATLKGSTNFEFASSNELWRASLDTIDFIPLASVNYSGGIIITDWYSANDDTNEQLKISIRFLTNEIRSDAVNIKVFTKKCDLENKCKITEESENLVNELTREILKKATLYEKANPDKKTKPYILSMPGE
jgi:hypothetical protein